MSLLDLANDNLWKEIAPYWKTWTTSANIPDFSFIVEDDVVWAKSNFKERDDSFIFQVALPGLSKEDFVVTLENGVLSVSYQHKKENNDINNFEYRSFSKIWNVSKETKEKDVSATYEKGILSVVIQKKDEVRPEKKTIEIK